MSRSESARRAAGAVIVRATPGDLAAVLALLREASLPTEGVREHFAEFWVACATDRVVGAIGLERYDPAGLLRSLVVAPAHRTHGVGRALVARLLAEAKAVGARRVFLLTETAAGFFAAHGFRPVTRTEVDAAVRASAEFTTLCCQSATCMRLDLSASD